MTTFFLVLVLAGAAWAVWTYNRLVTLRNRVQNAWKQYIETTYPQTSPGNPMCAIVPDDPAQREGVMKSYDLLKQPASQKVVKVSWKP